MENLITTTRTTLVALGDPFPGPIISVVERQMQSYGGSREGVNQGCSSPTAMTQPSLSSLSPFSLPSLPFS